MLFLLRLVYAVARGSVKAGIALVVILLSYALFYHLYVPVKHQSWPLYFVKKDADNSLDAYLKVEFGSNACAPSYDFILEAWILDIPDLLLRHGLLNTRMLLNGTILGERSMLPPYHSQIVRVVRSTALTIPILFGWAQEALIARHFLVSDVDLESLICHAKTTESAIKITLEDSQLPIQKALLHMVAHLSGLQYWMYHWRISCAFVVCGSVWVMFCLGTFLVEATHLLIALNQRIHAEEEHLLFGSGLHADDELPPIGRLWDEFDEVPQKTHLANDLDSLVPNGR